MSITDMIRMTNGWSQQSVTFRFDLLNGELNKVGDVDVLGHEARIDNNINRTIKRQMSGVALPPSVTESINPFTARFRPMIIYPDGREFPLGVFMLTDASRIRAKFSSVQLSNAGEGLLTQATLHDHLILLDIAYDRPLSFKPGTLITDAIEQVFETVAQWTTGMEWVIPGSDAKIRGKEWFVKPPGSNILEAVNELCAMAGFYSIYCTNEGIFTTKVVPDLAEPTALSYDEGGTVLLDSIIETDDLLSVPNRYIVINSSMTEQSIYGAWDVPSSAPHSIANRGRPVTVVYDIQGVDTNAKARATAKSMGVSDASTYRWVNFDAVPDPRHDTFDVVLWKDEPYREQSWSLDLVSSGVHHHELRRLYNPSEFDNIEDAWDVDVT